MLKEKLLDAILDGKIGRGITISRQEMITFFWDEPTSYTGAFLSNSEIETGRHSPTYDHFTIGIARGRYRVHPKALENRMLEREKNESKEDRAYISGGYTTYENTHNPHVTIHWNGCSQMFKRGGVQNYNQGRYTSHRTCDIAVSYAKSTGLPVIMCSYCKPK